MKKIFVIGIRGMLGSDVFNHLLLTDKYMLCGSDSDYMDITEWDSVKKVLDDHKVDIVINCAAYTNVAKAEEEKALCSKVNWDGVVNLVRYCHSKNIKLVHFSTDYVFDGVDEIFTEESETNPLNTYGLTKLLGDDAIMNHDPDFDYMILRIQWLFGTNGRNFIKTMKEIEKRGLPEAHVVNDQIGRPTSTKMVAIHLEQLIDMEFKGLINIGPQDYCSWYEFACEILRGSSVKVIPVESDQIASKVIRPKHNVLSLAKARSLNLKLKSWREHLSLYLKS